MVSFSFMNKKQNSFVVLAYTVFIAALTASTSFAQVAPGAGGPNRITMRPAEIVSLLGAAPTEETGTMEEQIPSFEWETDFWKAQKQAQKTDCYMVVVFSGSDWCQWCQKLDEEILSKDEFREYARRNIVSVMLDTPKSQLSAQPHKEIMKRYQVAGFPTVLVLNPKGVLIAKGGYMQGGPKAFIQFLKQHVPGAKLTLEPKPKGKGKFDRSPKAILAALEEKLKLESEGRVIEGEVKLQMDVTLGNWQGVKAYFASLPEQEAILLYDQLVSELRAMKKVGDQSRLKAVMEPQDFFALSDCMPGELQEEQLISLARLMQIIVSTGDYRQVILDQLNQGTARFGGSDHGKGLLTARLLFAADMIAEAGLFLPDPELSKQAGDIDTVKLHIQYLADRARRTNDPASLEKAWDLGQWILLEENSDPKERQAALALVLDLIPTLDRGKSEQWLRNRFTRDPEVGMRILSIIGDSTVDGVASVDIGHRKRNLSLLSIGVDALLEANQDASWDQTLNVLAWCWIMEAEVTLEAENKKELQRGRVGDEPRQPGQGQGGKPYIPLGDILKTAPDSRWASTLHPDLFMKVEMLVGRLNMKAGNMEAALKNVTSLAAGYPSQASVMADEYLRAWSEHVNNVPLGMGDGRYGDYWRMRASSGRRPEGIPLTRARQERNLDKLSELLVALNAVSPKPLNASTVIKVFSDCHSVAEVFQLEDVESVFGPAGQLPFQLRIELVSMMRIRLNKSWRDPKVQVEENTKRTETEMNTEVQRGYDVLEKLLEGGKDTPLWQYHRLGGMVMFDKAEFYYSLRDKDKEDDEDAYKLEEYTRQRNAALESFKKAAQHYAVAASTMKAAQRSPLVYRHWFFLVLGASDLTHLKRSTDLSRDYLEDIRQAILALPDKLAEEHMSAFGQSLHESLPRVGQNMKMRFLEAGLSVVGNHPSGEKAREAIDYYKELLGELKLTVRVDSLDNNTAVGYTGSFGLFIELQHTRAIERESGGFSRYLQNRSTGGGYRPHLAHMDYRKNFGKYISGALSENFEIQSVVFADPSVKSREYGRKNWRVTPLAYVLLKAKDPSVDMIPSIQMDMDFFDKQGQVVLPVLSAVLPIEAKKETPVWPLSDVRVVQILDSRELNDGKLKLEIDVSAYGLISSLDQLLDTDFADLKVDIEDRGVVADKLVTEDELAVQCQRSWVVNLEVPSKMAHSLMFKYPSLKKEFASASLVNKRYEDADIIDSEATVELSTGEASYWTIGLGLVLAVGIAWVLFLRFRGSVAKEQSQQVHVIPPRLTPFTVLSFLRHIENDTNIIVPDSETDSFQTDMKQIELAYFSPDGSEDQQPNLQQIMEKWIKLAK